MKKFATLGLAMTMLFSMATVAGAVDPVTDLANKPETSVKAKYSTDRQTTYSVNVTWGAMEFDYGVTEQWNTEKHRWDKSSEPSWSCAEVGGDIITLSNDSNVPLKATFSFAKSGTGDADVSGTFIDPTLETADKTISEVNMGVAQEEETADTHSVQFVPSGTVTEDYSNEYSEVGTITVTIAKIPIG